MLDLHRGESTDIHWHAWSTETVEELAVALDFFGTRDVQETRFWAPDGGEPQTVGDILIAWNVKGRKSPNDTTARLRAIHAEYSAALSNVEQAVRRRAGTTTVA